MQKAWEPIQALEAEMKAAGAWVFSARLHDPDTATVVRVSDDEVVTTDGPFVEAHGIGGAVARLFWHGPMRDNPPLCKSLLCRHVAGSRDRCGVLPLGPS